MNPDFSQVSITTIPEQAKAIWHCGVHGEADCAYRLPVIATVGDGFPTLIGTVDVCAREESE